MKIQKDVRGIQQKVLQVKTGTWKWERSMKLLRKDVEQLENDFDELQQTLENIDNSLRGNNSRLRGLKEGAEGNALRHFLEGVFTS